MHFPSCSCKHNGPTLLLMWIPWSSQNDVASDAFTRVGFDQYPCWTNCWKETQRWITLFLDETVESPKEGPQLGSANVWLDLAPTHFLVRFMPSVIPGEKYSKLLVCLATPWFPPSTVGGRCQFVDPVRVEWCWAAAFSLFVSSFQPQGGIEYGFSACVCHVYLPKMRDQHPIVVVKNNEGWAMCEQRLKFRKCWIWGMKNWIASGKTMCWTGLLFTLTREPRWKMPDFSWSGPTFWLKPRRFSRSNRGLEVGRLDG